MEPVGKFSLAWGKSHPSIYNSSKTVFSFPYQTQILSSLTRILIELQTLGITSILTTEISSTVSSSLYKILNILVSISTKKKSTSLRYLKKIPIFPCSNIKKSKLKNPSWKNLSLRVIPGPIQNSSSAYGFPTWHRAYNLPSNPSENTYSHFYGPSLAGISGSTKTYGTLTLSTLQCS